MSDDTVNVALLVAVLIFAAVAFPNLVAYERDASFGAAVRQPFTISDSESRTEECMSQKGYSAEEECTLAEMTRAMGGAR